ncbi:hypothetical protein KUCAC02_000440 [Chaenocephalus aceratus]|uniref:Uncharacterized protein n=1 Tax=Chaenocephalus aceratus TaxID=36190 RepID=A0ACB9W712_CHAAC|nr:hypothetical protein KUCAC02_000440 [Chaenocephalus aceratus]
MPTAKDKAGSASHRYRPASEYDDATLTQKRQYWRTKKREQRARLTERRGKSSHNSQGGKFSHDDSYKAVNVSPAPQTGKRVGDSSAEAAGRKEKWLSSMELNKVLPQFTASSSIPAKAARCSVATVRGAVSRAVTAHSGTQLNPPSVPPVRVTRTTNGSSAHTHLQPCVSMQGAPVPNTQNEAQVVLRILPKLSPPSVTAGMTTVSSPCVPVSIKTEGQTASALVTTQSAKGVSNSHSAMEPEDQRAARRREQWRIKKREQRAKQAAQVARAREKTQSGEMTMARQTAQKAGLVGGAILQHLPSQSLLRGAVQKQCPTRVKASFPSAKRETYKLQIFGSRNMPHIDPNDTPEQIIAKRREYWRVKKREQRAKLSMEVRGRLMEKDSLMRRVKRYQDILEEIRRSRAMAQSGGSILTSEAIGGFIKEDGTLTTNIPQVSADHTAARRGEEEAAPVSTPQHPPDAQQKGTTPIGVNQPPPPASPYSDTVTGGPTAGSHLGGCVMKMTVSSSAVSLSALSLDPALTEEERMAKKREYWRIKKREQRAARLKQGVLHARATAAVQRRRAQKQAAGTPASAGGSLTGNARSLPDNSGPITPNAHEIKQESEPVPAVDLNSQPEHAICPKSSPPTSPPPPPAPQPEPDPALGSDSQATTLLAVASMKKLLEESLSTVTHIKVESKEEASQEETEPTSPQNEEGAPIAADLTLEIKSWQPDSDALVPAGSQSPPLKDAPQSSDTPPHPPNSNEVVLNPTCDHSSQTPSHFILDPSVEASDTPSSPHRTLSLPTKTESHESSCSPEPPKLHHLPMVQPQPRQQHCEQHIQEEGQSSPSAGGYCGVGPELSGMMSLQRKREYWKLMKRQQRARLRARQRERQAECSSRPKHMQAPVSGVPTLLAVSPTTCRANRSPDRIQVKLPVPPPASRPPRTQQNHMDTGQMVSTHQGDHENQQGMTQKWTLSRTGVHKPPFPPPLKPPENPLSSINLQPIEPPHAPSHPRESEEDFLRRKREYWRVKKKEQRARKAIRGWGGNPQPPEVHPARAGTSKDTDPASFPFSGFSAAAEDESDLLFADYDQDEEEGPVSDAVWRNRYLMDHDPLNQLLVCMVCGELQYSHSLEGVRGHIDEAHPHTLSLEPGEQRQILEAWDEQVSRRERFFTSQLQQHSAPTDRSRQQLKRGGYDCRTQRKPPTRREGRLTPSYCFQTISSYLHSKSS